MWPAFLKNLFRQKSQEKDLEELFNNTKPNLTEEEWRLLREGKETDNIDDVGC